MIVHVEPDGTRVYSKGMRYRPLSPEERTYAVRRPADPRAVRYHGEWYLPLEVLQEDQRVMPETMPDEIVYEHMPRHCRCPVCARPPAVTGRWIRKWRRDNGLRPG